MASPPSKGMKQCFVLFFAALLTIIIITPCVVVAQSGIVKICVIGGGGDNGTTANWSHTIDRIALFIARQHIKAPQIYKHQSSGDECEFIGSVDRAKFRADFILVVKSQNSTVLDCDPEWGRQSFAIMNLLPMDDDEPHNGTFNAQVAFTSTEKASSPPKWHNVTTSSALLRLLLPQFLSPQSRIPDEFPFKAEREERVKRRTLKAVIALMALVIGALLVLLFLGSLARHNERKREREAECQKKLKKKEKEMGSDNNKSEKSEKSGKTEKTTTTTTTTSKKEQKEQKEQKTTSAKTEKSKKD